MEETEKMEGGSGSQREAERVVMGGVPWLAGFSRVLSKELAGFGGRWRCFSALYSGCVG